MQSDVLEAEGPLEGVLGEKPPNGIGELNTGWGPNRESGEMMSAIQIACLAL